MKFSLSVVLASLAASVTALPLFTNSDFSGIKEGSPFEITWADAVGPVTITVVTGPEKNLVPVQTITSTGTGGKYEWTPQGLPSGSYALRIQDSTSEPNFSAMFTYTGTGTLTTSGASSSVASITSAPASSSGSTSSAFSAPTTSSTSTKTTSTHSTTTASNTSKPTNTNDSPQAKSPLALVLLAVAALAYFQ